MYGVLYAGAMSPCTSCAARTGRIWKGASFLQRRSDDVARAAAGICSAFRFKGSSGAQRHSLGLFKPSAARQLLNMPGLQRSLHWGHITSAKMQDATPSSEPLEDAGPGRRREGAFKRIKALQDYAEHIARVDTTRGVIEIPPNLPPAIPPCLRYSIMIRPCYLVVLSKLEALGECFGVVLSGSPGIGTSSFAVLLLHYLAKQGAKVAYRYKSAVMGNTIIYFDFSDLSAIKVKSASEWSVDWPSLTSHLDMDVSVWWIWEGRAPQAQFQGLGRDVVLCSPETENYKQFIKGRETWVWWLPVWSLHEMQKCRDLLYPDVPEKELEARFLEFGGLIRNVLADPANVYPFGVPLKRVLSSLSAEQALSLYEQSTSLGGDLRYMFAHIAVSDDLKRKDFFLGSPIVKEAVFARSWEGRSQDREQLVELLHRGARLKKVSCKLMEDALFSYGHAVLRGGIELGKSDIRQVFNQVKQTGDVALSGEQERAVTEIRQAFSEPKTLAWDYPSGIRHKLSELSQSYLQPITADPGSWDSLVCSGDSWVNAILFKRDPKQGIKAGGVQKLLQRIRASGKKLRIVHAVPANVFDSYRWQPWVDERPVQKEEGLETKEIVSQQDIILPVDEFLEDLQDVEQLVVRFKLPELVSARRRNAEYAERSLGSNQANNVCHAQRLRGG